MSVGTLDGNKRTGKFGILGKCVEDAIHNGITDIFHGQLGCKNNMLSERKILDKFLWRMDKAGLWCFSDADIRSWSRQAAGTDLSARLLAEGSSSGIFKRLPGNLWYIPKSPHLTPFCREDMVHRLRRGEFFYVSFESALRQYGVIFESFPALTVATTGKSEHVKTEFGDILFMHMDADCSAFFNANLFWDERRRMNIASPELAYEDLKEVGRNLDLINMADLERAIEEYPALPPIHDNFPNIAEMSHV